MTLRLKRSQTNKRDERRRASLSFILCALFAGLLSLSIVNHSSFFRDKTNGNDYSIKEKTTLVAKRLRSFRDLGFQGSDEFTAPFLLKDFGILFCWIPKASCTKIKHLSLRVAGDPNWNSSDFDPHAFRTPYMKDILITQNNASVSSILDDALLKKVALIREPLERFLSAYLDITASRCRMRRANNTCYGISAADVIDFFERKDLWTRNVHFSHQVNFCGFRKLQDTRFWNIVLYDRQKIAQDIIDATNGRLEYVIQRGWPGKGLFRDSVKQETFGSTNYINLRENVCENHTLFSNLLNWLRIDYDAFQIPVPNLKVFCSA